MKDVRKLLYHLLIHLKNRIIVWKIIKFNMSLNLPKTRSNFIISYQLFPWFS